MLFRSGLRVGKETYAHVLEPTYPSRALIEHVIPFDQFRSSGHSLTRTQAAEIDGLVLDTSVPNATLYLDRLTTYRQQTYSSWLSFASSHPQHNIFQPGERVAVTLASGGVLPAGAKAFRYEVQDFYEQVVTKGQVKVDGSDVYRLDLTPETHGYYELRAYWVDEGGKDLEPRSCILAEGSLPPGVATFSLLHRTVTQNIERFKELGTNAFYGLHGDFMGLADLMGLTWRFEYSSWSSLEPRKPNRSHGVAPWAAARIEGEPARPDYRLHVLPFSGNFSLLDWANGREGKTATSSNWEDYLAWVRDCVKVEKHLYPHQRPRIYGVAWEVNLNMPPFNMGPAYTPAEIVELHRRTREAIQSTDSDSLVIGPCPSNLNPQWFEPVFRAGLLRYVDAIETHGYADTGFAPEENDYPGKLAALRDLIRGYNAGKVLPIYITEAGIRGQLGSKIVHRSQAQFMTRLAIILQGEGIRAFLPFYGIDYDRDGWWGFCFNLEVDAKSPWSTRRISPKPTVNAIAACVNILEGARPVRRVTGLGENVWAYLFAREGASTLAIWSAAGQKRISLHVGSGAAIELIDIMGHDRRVPLRAGVLELNLDGSPQYLVGVSPTGLP